MEMLSDIGASSPHQANSGRTVALDARRAGPLAPRAIEVRRQRASRRLGLLGLLLVIMLASVFLAALLASAIAVVFLPEGGLWSFGWPGVPVTLCVGVLAAVSHWWLSQRSAQRRLLAAMHGMPPDAGDRYHRRLENIVDELRLATGEVKIRCVVVPSLGMNAFAFSDLRGGGVVGVTEGAVSRLSRAQLEGVLAHEFAHVVSGSYRTSTLACLLFGIFADDEKVANEPAGDGSPLMGRIEAGMLIGVLSALRWAAAIPAAALSRQDELEADRAAARYTQDPISLAEALRAIALHGAGAGYIPRSLAPLCIREAECGAGWLKRRTSTHPSLESRISALLAMAGVSHADFESQVRRLGRARARREHVRQPRWPAETAPLVASASSGGCCGQNGAAAGCCPVCGAPLVGAEYEGAYISACQSCGGRWLRAVDVPRIVARREVSFSEDQCELAGQLIAQADDLRRVALRRQPCARSSQHTCPGCGTPMVRRHFSYEDPVEIHYCALCDAYWFDRDELEVLQLVAERRLS